jgi:hypothetical protein
MYVSARGWLQVDHQQRDAVEAIIAEAHDDFYAGGWSFPRKPFNWSLYVFYGGDIRVSGLPWLRSQVDRIAAMEPVDDDGDMPIGLFVLTDETAQVTAWKSAMEWSATGQHPNSAGRSTSRSTPTGPADRYPEPAGRDQRLYDGGVVNG